MTWRSRVASAALGGALAAVAGMAFQRVFQWQALVPVVAVAASLPILLSLALRLRGPRPLWQALALSVVGWLLVVSETLFRGATLWGFLPTPFAVGTAVGALRDSSKAILTTILPAPGAPGLLVLVHVLVWAAAFAAAELALRTRSVVGPAVPPACVLAVALLLGVDGAGNNLPVVVLMVGLSGLLVLVRAPGNALTWGSALGAPALACLALAAGLVGPSLPLVQARQPFDPRQYVSPPPPDPRAAVNPLDEVSAWLQNPDTPLFTVRAASGQNWRLVALDRFDGTTWSPSATFVAAGSRVPSPPPSVGTDAVDQQVTIQGLRGLWLPAASRPSSVSGVSVYVDPGSGVLMSATPLRAGLRYEAISAVPGLTVVGLRDSAPAADAEARAALALPGARQAESAVPEPVEMQRFALQATSGAITPYQEALQLADYLRANEVNDVTAPPGHAYRNLEFFLTTSHHGTSEQFATTYALMARTLGLPSRVVVGFRPGHAARGVWQVRSGDVLVWPEIDFRGLGWVPFYPTPEQGGAAGTRAVPAGETAARQAIDQQIAAGAAQPPISHLVPRRPALPVAARDWWRVGVLILMVVVVAYAGLVLAVPRWRRRRRRRRQTPAGRVVAAWHETLDELRWLGLPSVRTLSAGDVASLGAAAISRATGGRERPLAEAVSRAAANHLRPLAEAVNQAGFAPEPPDAASAEAAWRHSDTVRRMVARALPLRARLRRGLDPRSLWPRASTWSWR